MYNAFASVVAVDVDRTLINGQSQWHLVNRLRSERLIPPRLWLRLHAWFLWHTLGGRAPDPAGLQSSAIATLAGVPRPQLDELIRDVVAQELMPVVRTDGVAAIRDWRSKGARVVLVSAAIEPLISALAVRLDADGVVATRIESNREAYTGRMVEPMLMGEAKWHRLCGFADERFGRWRLAAAYGDDIIDLPILSRAERAVAVNPSTALAKEARARKWEIARWR